MQLADFKDNYVTYSVSKNLICALILISIYKDVCSYICYVELFKDSMVGFLFNCHSVTLGYFTCDPVI